MAKIHFLNVDEGDCSIIQHDDGKVTMIDICCGNIEEQVLDSTTISAETLNSVRGNFNQKAHPTNPVTYLRTQGIREIFRYIQTHPDMDHMDGLKSLKDSVNILNFWDTKNTKEQTFDANGRDGRYLKEDWDITPLDNGSFIRLASVDTDGHQERVDSRPFTLHVTEDYFTLEEHLHCQ